MDVEARNLCCWASKFDLAISFILPSNKDFELIGAFLNSYVELSSSSLDEARAASLLAWNNSVVKSVDMAVACLIDLATASRSLERAATDIDSCCNERKAAEENRSAWELIATSSLAFLSHASRFLSGIEALPLLEMSRSDASASNWGILSVGKYWFWLL